MLFDSLGAVAHRECHRQARNCNRLAPKRVSIELALEE
jgi:hypothetical protein